MLSQKHRRALAISVILGVSIYFAAIISGDSEKILEALRSFELSDWAMILSIAFCNFIFRFLRWQMYISSFNYSIPWKLHFTYYMAGLALTTTPAKAGEILRSFYLVPHGVAWTKSLACFFTERFLDVFIVSIASLFILYVLPGLNNSYTVILVPLMSIMLIGLFTLQTSLPVKTLAYIKDKISYNVIDNLLGYLVNILDTARHILHFRYLLPGLILGTLAWSMHGIVFYLITIKAGFAIDPVTAIVVFGFSVLAGALSMIPGGIGATEVALGLLLNYLGAESHVAVLAPILTRLATLWYAVTIGLIANSYLGSINIHPQNQIGN